MVVVMVEIEGGEKREREREKAREEWKDGSGLASD